MYFIMCYHHVQCVIIYIMHYNAIADDNVLCVMCVTRVIYNYM